MWLGITPTLSPRYLTVLLCLIELEMIAYPAFRQGVSLDSDTLPPD